MRYKAVVFDMDGTLLDTLADLADAMNPILEKRGFPIHPTESYRYFVGSGAREIVSRALPADMRENILDECLQEYLENYKQGWKRKTRLYDGVPELLDALVTKNMTLAILTNKPQDFANACAREFLSPWTFAQVWGQRPGAALKPDPAASRPLIAALDVQPEEILYLGDTDVDMETAVSAGMYPVGVLWGFRCEDELRQTGAAATIAHPLDLLHFLD